MGIYKKNVKKISQYFYLPFIHQLGLKIPALSLDKNSESEGYDDIKEDAADGDADDIRDGGEGATKQGNVATMSQTMDGGGDDIQ